MDSDRSRRRLHPGWRTAGSTHEDIDTKLTVWRLIARAVHQRRARMTLREFKVLMWRFGFCGGEHLSLDEVGEKFSLSRERARQMEAKALRRLRRAAGIDRVRARPGAERAEAPIGRWVTDVEGELRLTCDECRAAFAQTMRYPTGCRPIFVGLIRSMGHLEGWTCITGRDRCPDCSQIVAPDRVGNGAGEDEDHEQDADRGQ